MNKKLPGDKSFAIRRSSFIVAIIGALLFLPFLGKVHLFDWDEINFAECAREMIVMKKYFLVTINYLPFWEKPPLFIWMQALCMNIFGVTDYAARLPNAICGIVTLVVIFKIGTLCKNPQFGMIWVLAYAGSLLPHFYFKSGIIDPWFNFFIFTGIYFFMRVQMEKKQLVPGKAGFYMVCSAFLLGLAILTKGPVALLIFSLCLVAYWLVEKRRAIATLGETGLFMIVLLASGGLWFIAEIITGHSDVIRQFIDYQLRLFNTPDSGHGGPFYFHVVILLIGCFPASIFALRGMSSEMKDDEKGREMSLWMGILFWITLILFSIVKTKIIHYSSLCYYPLTYFAALAITNLLDGDVKWRRWMTWGLSITGGLIAIALLALPVIGMNAQAIIKSGILKDPFAAANLEADIHWSYADCLLGVLLLGTLVVALISLHKGKMRKGILIMFLGSLATTNLALVVIAPKIEMLTQQAAVEFYQTLQGKDVYVATLGFKSYANYYYSAEQPSANPNSDNMDWLLKGDIDKPAYFVCKINHIDEYKKQYPQLKEIGRKNGFVFLERETTKPHAINEIKPNLPDDSGFTNKAEAENKKVHGLKEGKWAEYFTEEDEYDNVHPTTDTAAAAFYMLTYYKNNKPIGISRKYSKNGALLTEIPYLNGKVNGILKRYYDSTGIISAEETYSNDKLNGVYKEFDWKGNITTELFYVNDEQTGMEKEYYSNGKLKSEVPLINGDRNGIGKTYYDDGKLASETSYHNDIAGATKAFELHN